TVVVGLSEVTTNPLSWDSANGKLNLNLSGTALAPAETECQFQLDGLDGFATTVFMDSHGATSAIDFRQQGGTKASPTATASAATMGQINFQGWDGTTYAKSARVRASAQPSGANWTGSDHGTKLGFFTTAPGSTSNTEKVSINGDGGVSIGALGSHGIGTVNLAALFTNDSLSIDSSGAMTAPSFNKVAITAPASGATLTIPNGVTFTGPAASGTAMTLGNNETVTGVKTFGAAGNVGKLAVAGTTNGSTVLNASATASGTLTLPAATDTLIGKATTDTLTNKTFDTAGTGNSFMIASFPVTSTTGTGAVAVRQTSPALITPDLGTPSAGTMTNVTGLPISTGVSGLGTGVATFLAPPSSANLRSALTDEVGTGAAYFVGGALGTPASGTLTNATGLPLSGLTSQGAFTLVGNNTGSSAAPTAVDIHTLTSKATPAGTDEVMISDQAASGAWKRATVSSLATSAGVSSIAGNTGAFTLTTGITNSTNAIKLALNNVTLQTTSASPTGTTGTAMMGLGSTCTLTPAYSTRIYLVFHGDCQNSSVAFVDVQARYGTGAAPANGAAATGTTLGGLIRYNPTTAANAVPFTVGGVITGLTPGTAYWFDICLAVTVGTGSAAHVTCSAFEF